MKSDAPPTMREPVLMTALRLKPENATRLLAMPAPTPSTTPSTIGIARYRMDDTSCAIPPDAVRLSWKDASIFATENAAIAVIRSASAQPSDHDRIHISVKK